MVKTFCFFANDTVVEMQLCQLFHRHKLVPIKNQLKQGDANDPLGLHGAKVKFFSTTFLKVMLSLRFQILSEKLWCF